MISLSSLADLVTTYRDELDQPVAPLQVGPRLLDLDSRPAVMGCINLSRESTYRDSIAVSVDSALRRGRVLAAHGADIIDLGAESSTPQASRVPPEDQIAALTPVVKHLSAVDIAISVETHHPDIARACLEAGANMINYSGGAPYDEPVFELVAEFDAAIVLCHIPGADARDIRNPPDDPDPIAALLDHFTRRVATARNHGVRNIVIDPGIGFSHGPPAAPAERVNRQTWTLLNAFRLRRLGLPVCQALPHAFDLFEDQYRSAEVLFTVLAHLGGCSIYRTHEVARIIPVLTALHTIKPR